jgi:hypothetical protein
MPRPARGWAAEHVARMRAAVGAPARDFVRTTAQLSIPEQLLAALGGRAQRAAREPTRSAETPAEAPADRGRLRSSPPTKPSPGASYKTTSPWRPAI